jgi:hypothetical protein
MALMMGKLHEALVSAGTDPGKAREAAEEVAAHDASIAELRGTQKLHTWILSFNTAMMLAILWKVFSP